jgi:hemolysin III
MIEMVEQPVAPTAAEDVVVAHPQQHRRRPTPGGSPKPLLRGWIHAAAAIVTVLCVAIFVTSAAPDQRLPLIVFGGSIVELYAVSATFHVLRWHGKIHSYLRLLDHCSIFVMIAATATAFAATIPLMWVRLGLIAFIWTAAAAGMAAKVLHPSMSRILSTVLYVVMGWIGGCTWLILGLVLSPATAPASVFGVALLPLALAGFFYTLGAVIYVRRAPDWWPTVFGYHELFHVLVVLANTTVTVAVLHVAGILPIRWATHHSPPQSNWHSDAPRREMSRLNIHRMAQPWQDSISANWSQLGQDNGSVHSAFVSGSAPLLAPLYLSP